MAEPDNKINNEVKEVSPTIETEKKTDIDIEKSSKIDDDTDGSSTATTTKPEESIDDDDSSKNGRTGKENGIVNNDDDEASTVNPTKLEQQIIEQIEYYFSDLNLARDKFLQGEISKDEDGWVPLSVLLTFKRLAFLSKEVSVIVNALRKSSEKLIEISGDEQFIRRTPSRPLPEQNEETRKELMTRTVYCKGFPSDCTMNDLIDFFKQFEEKVVNIVMRKYLDKPTKENRFKGSTFVTFSNDEQYQKFLKLKNVQFKDQNLQILPQIEYFKMKKAERVKSKHGKVKNAPEITLPRGTVIYLTGIGSDTKRESIKNAFIKLGGDVAYVDFSKGDKEGHVRLNIENSAKEIFNKMTDGKIKIDDVDVNAKIVEGEEETEFLLKAVQNMKSKRNQHKGGRHQGRKRQAEQDDEKPAKRRNVDTSDE